MKFSQPLWPPTSRRPWGLNAALILCLGWAWGSAAALEGDQEQPLLIESDSVELDGVQDISVYTGNVQIDQGSMRILADQVTVNHKEDRRPRFIVAVGNPVRYRQAVEGEKGDVQAHAERMEYDADKDELTLIGHAELTQTADRFASDRIVYDRARSQVKAGTSAQGSGRVQITFTPDKEPEGRADGRRGQEPGKGPGRTPNKAKGKQ
jgi:lipopolysaccharide export system protein LptA